MSLFRPTANRRFNELIGLLILVLATLLALALLSYHPADQSLDTAVLNARPQNWVGPVGAYTADLLFQCFGVAAFLIVTGLAGSAVQWFRPPTGKPAQHHRISGILLCMLSISALLQEFPRNPLWRNAVPWSGLTGRLLATALLDLFNRTGAYILTGTALLAGLFLATNFSLIDLHNWAVEEVYPRLMPVLGPIVTPWLKWRAWREESLKRREERREERRERLALARAEAREARKAKAAERKALRREKALERQKAKAARKRYKEEEEWEDEDDLAPEYEGEAGIGSEDGFEAEAEEYPDAQYPADIDPGELEEGDLPPVLTPRPAQAAGQPTPNVRPFPAPTARPAAAAATVPVPERVIIAPPEKGYEIPPSTLLQEVEPGQRINENELRQIAASLRSKCDEFGVRGQVTQIDPGPVVTTYEFKPEAGVKYSRITALSEDLCLALAAESIYIERLPGKSTVGIEVPNPHRETIYLREIVESSLFRQSRVPLTMAMGKDANGEIVISDLAGMPHLLIAGSTGSGKSVALNSMIVSMLYKSTPDQLRFILVDPKRLELGLYRGIPHLYTPIITEPKLAANALRNAVREMERRLKLLATRGVRNIGQYNRLFEEGQQGLFENLRVDDENKPLPYIVIIIDELADLMIVDSSNVEESITRLAQMARAVGIHLILATQRPSVDVITGLIKANFPARMSFRVATKIDSRTILDSQGAESLLGKGDMLFLPPGTSRFQRVHGAFVTEKEIGRVVKFWSQQEQPGMDESFLKPPAEEGDEAGGGPGGDDHDPLYEDALRIVLEQQKASTSLLQRRLRIGYGRAAHLIDLMHADGIVGPADGPRPREVLKRPDWLSEVPSAIE